METKQLQVSKDGLLNKADLNEARSSLQAGQLVAFPTETVYGLGADARNSEAIEKIYEAKGRPSDNPLIAHVGNFDQLKQLVKSIPTYVEVLINQFSPGPITYILKHNEQISPKVTAGLDTIAIRIPNHPLALQLLNAVDFPVAAPSANLSGKPSPTAASHVLQDLTGKIPIIINGGHTGVGLESTVIDCTGEIPMILRHGSITGEMIEKTLEITLDPDVKPSSKPKSPGLKYKHYAPSIPLTLVRGDHVALKKVIFAYQASGKKVGLLLSNATAKQLEVTSHFELGEEIDQVAGNLYHALRSFEGTDYDMIIVESFKEEGLGIAVMDRLTRAATHVI